MEVGVTIASKRELGVVDVSGSVEMRINCCSVSFRERDQKSLKETNEADLLNRFVKIAQLIFLYHTQI